VLLVVAHAALAFLPGHVCGQSGDVKTRAECVVWLWSMRVAAEAKPDACVNETWECGEA
jgi:hypothetical protein